MTDSIASAAAAATPEVTARRRRVTVAGHLGDRAGAVSGLADDDASVRIAALGAMERLGELTDELLVSSFDDHDINVRRRAAELAAAHTGVDLVPLLHDTDATVIEIAAWSCGEHESNRDEIVERLIALAAADDPLVRESAVAALGAIGDERALATIVAAATGDKPAVRRRAVLALAPFDGPEVEAAIEQALTDRDWQVRQSAEDLAPAAD